MAQLKPNAKVSAGGTSSDLNNVNLLQPTSFKLVVDRKHYKNLEFFCQSVMLPSLSAVPVEIPYRRITSIPFAADKLTYGELTANILLDENMNSYIELYNWMHRLVELNEVSPSERASGVPTYADITVAILSSHNNTTRNIRYQDCIPTLLGDVSLEAATGDVTPVVIPVSFKFSKFTIVN